MSAVTNQGTRRTLRIILCLSGHSFEGLSLKAIADTVNEQPPTALRDLQVLEQEGFAERIPGRESFWRLSPRLVQVAIAHQSECARLEQRVADFTNRYSRNTN